MSGCNGPCNIAESILPNDVLIVHVASFALHCRNELQSLVSLQLQSFVLLNRSPPTCINHPKDFIYSLLLHQSIQHTVLGCCSFECSGFTDDYTRVLLRRCLILQVALKGQLSATSPPMGHYL